MFQTDNRGQLWPGLEVHFINFSTADTNPVANGFETRSAFGRAVIVDQAQCEIQVYPFYDLIHANFGTDITKDVSSEPSINLGASVQDFVQGSRRVSARNGFFEADIR